MKKFAIALLAAIGLSMPAHAQFTAVYSGSPCRNNQSAICISTNPVGVAIGAQTPTGTFSVTMPTNTAATAAVVYVGSATQATPLLTVVGSGNVGIGNDTTPDAPLEIIGRSDIATNGPILMVSSANATTTLFSVDSSGRLSATAASGGGNTLALTNSGSNATIRLTASAGNANSQLQLFSDVNWYIINAANGGVGPDNSLSFFNESVNNSVVSITQTGYLGVGQGLSPIAAEFQVQQSSSVAPTSPILRVSSASAGVIFDVLANGNVGISTSAPNARLALVAAGAADATADAITISSANQLGTYLAVDAGSGHIEVSSNTPTIANCGTGTQAIIGNDSWGKITMGTAPSGTLCAITFTKAWKKAPSCTVQDEATAVLLRPVTTTTSMTMVGVLIAADTVNYHCFGIR